jgi:antitoxin HicB
MKSWVGNAKQSSPVGTAEVGRTKSCLPSAIVDGAILPGYRSEVESVAIKRVLAWQFEQEMIRQQKTKRAMAVELKTSRSQLDRLLDPKNTAVSLDTLTRAAHVLGKRLVLEIRDAQPQGVQAKRAGQHSTRGCPG